MLLVYWLFIKFIHVLPVFKFSLGQVHERIHTWNTCLA